MTFNNQHAAAAYGTTQKQNILQRSEMNDGEGTSGQSYKTEVMVLHNIASRLTKVAKKIQDEFAKDEKVSRETEEEYLDTLRRNWRMWTIFQVELLEEDHPANHDTKVELLSLAKFVDDETLIALSTIDLEILGIFASVNQEIAAGLIDANKASEEALSTQQKSQ